MVRLSASTSELALKPKSFSVPKPPSLQMVSLTVTLLALNKHAMYSKMDIYLPLVQMLMYKEDWHKTERVLPLP